MTYPIPGYGLFSFQTEGKGGDGCRFCLIDEDCEVTSIHLFYLIIRFLHFNPSVPTNKLTIIVILEVLTMYLLRSGGKISYVEN